ncbi:MAG: DUF4332 domain-containing protein [Deltaproteobacteria bacterium]|nr:DUF4332 domain-containing protein [Deltaproteobacteria bacterium]
MRSITALIFALTLVISPLVMASSYPLDQVLPKAAVTKLAKTAIHDTDGLLSKGASKTKRVKLAKDTGLGLAQLTSWVFMADLVRVKGVGPQMARLLEAAKVPTVAKLRRQGAGSLFKRMMEVNKTQKISDNPPSKSQVAHWIRLARKLKIVARP